MVLGGMGSGNVRPLGKSSLTFDHVLSQLQGELQKSRETGAELHKLTGAVDDIRETGRIAGAYCLYHKFKLTFFLLR
jgi:hypothetical protein